MHQGKAAIPCLFDAVRQIAPRAGINLVCDGRHARAYFGARRGVMRCLPHGADACA
jgi:hypothetical protein